MNIYNREKAVSYAQRWALNSNPTFYHFGGIGGDCTNFISQCLLAGGAPMVFDKIYGWYYKNSRDRSASWTSVKYLQDYLLRKKRFGINAKIEKIQNLYVGDLIQLRQSPNQIFNHTVIITKITGNEIYVCAHSNDALNRPLSDYNFAELLGLHILN